MSEYFFLTYANISLIKSPHNYYRIVEKFNFWNEKARSHFTQMIDALIITINHGHMAYAGEQLEKAAMVEGASIRAHPNIINYVYGYEDGCGYESCTHLDYYRYKVLGEDILSGNARLKCFECDQQYFIYILKQIVSGTEFSKIIGFPDLISNCTFSEKSLIQKCKDESSPFKEKFKKVRFQHAFCDANYEFRFFYYSAVLSLIEFMTNNDRRSLKLCPYCENFFIAGDKRQQRCKNKDCKRAYEREKKQRQREKDPAKYC